MSLETDGMPRPASAAVLELGGLYPATITPFAEDLSIDFAALESHLAGIAEIDGVRGLVVNGGLGEILQLTDGERAEVIELAVKVRQPGQLVIAGIEGCITSRVVQAALQAKDAGADALLVFPPFDVRPYRRLANDAESVRRFFAELDRSADIPMIVFQYPPQSGCAYSLAALQEIVKLPNVVGVKAASATAPVYAELWDLLHREVAVLAAVDSPPLLDMLRHGSHGALIGISAIAPWVWVELLEAVSVGDTERADHLYEKVCKPLMAAVFENQQPTRNTSEAATTKEALVQMGQIPSSRVRPPAVDVDDVTRAEIADAVERAGLRPDAVAAG